MHTPPKPAPDLTTVAYWDQVAQDTKLARPIDPAGRSPRNRLRRAFHEEFTRGFGEAPLWGRRILEIGCAGSVWLPYFHRTFGLDVAGLDYSEEGCAQSRRVMQRENVPCEIICADLFAPPDHLMEAFDYVVSFGVVEHFTDTASALAVCARLVRPGGTLITFVPNMAGSVGLLQRWVDRAVYDIHVSLDAPTLARAHAEAGLQNLSTRYLASTGYSVANMNKAKGPMRIARQLVWTSAVAASLGIWVVESVVCCDLPATRFFSPFVANWALKSIHAK
ncbi:MAG: class I SAM-dependent methyltransferase [Acidobacteria bacterium]|nr:class I SAM-dependent methyltransferase [Acidobacteriota bacterium]